MISLVQAFKARKEVLGINDRNLNFQFLNRGKRKLADNKLMTKQLLKKSEIPSPEIYGVIRNIRDLEKFDFEKLPKSFVLKPAHGVKGAGINIYYNRLNDGRWVLADRSKHTVDDIKSHVLNILDGQFTLGIIPRPSAAIFEERIKMHATFKLYSYRGIPDIRIIVYKNVPVMAMLRLPTEESEGKANISRGAIGVGIDMARGVTTFAIKNGHPIETVPGTNLRLSGIKIPYWTKVLRIASQCQIVSGLGFLGVDIIIDREKGPFVVELNARPGLGIQIANLAGLKERLQRIKKLKNVSEERGIRLAKDLFGGEIEAEVEEITGREVIGSVEEITLFSKDKKEKIIKGKIDTGADSSSIDRKLAVELGYKHELEFFDDLLKNYKGREEKLLNYKIPKKFETITKIDFVESSLGKHYRIYVEVPVKMGQKHIVLKANIADRSHLSYPVLVGKRDLKEFLIDTTKA